jgi:Arc/MetJ-type ribon-helix-helix transcriptional regulator
MEHNPETGKFVERPDSLTRKPLAVRIPKLMREEFALAVEAEEKTESECIREAIALWLEQRKKSGL